jgi:AAA+ ATPase superfamily predicted ATPase
MFVGRKTEINHLREELSASTPSLVIMYGRRRVGKSTLIQKAAENSKLIYFQATQDLPDISLAAFKSAVADVVGADPILADLASWDGVLNHIAVIAQKFPNLVVALDEFPYLCDQYEALPSVIQKFFDSGAPKKGSLKLILCGSVIASMEKLLSGKSPLYGRQTLALNIHQLPLRDAVEFYSDYSATDSILTYGAFGGIPYYLEKINQKISIEENIKQLLLLPNAPLGDEPEILLRSEVTEPARYNAILRAIAAGKTKGSEIRDSTSGMKDPWPYLDRLKEMRVIEGVKPLTSDEFSRDTRYFIVDPLTSFWHRFVRPYLSAIKQGHGDDVWAHRIQPNLSTYMGPIFEEICRSHVTEFGAEFLSSPPQIVGRIWHKDYDIDVAGELLDGSHIFGEVKWTNELVGVSVLETLMQRADICGYGNEFGRHFVLFSKSGFTEDLIARSERDTSVILITPSQMIQWPEEKPAPRTIFNI